jgi:hypothetical protein
MMELTPAQDKGIGQTSNGKLLHVDKEEGFLSFISTGSSPADGASTL